MTAAGLIEALLSDKHREPIDPKAVYRTRDVKLFEEAAAALAASEASRRRADSRARARLHALKQSLAFAKERFAACNRQADKYRADKSDDEYWERSERCAANEARYIAENIAQLIKEAASTALSSGGGDGEG